MFSATRADQGTVLLIDDDDLLRGMSRILLEKSGFRVLEAGDALGALLIAMQRRGAVDLVITNVAMPKISGAELGRVFNQIWPGLNVLYMSGSSREAVREELPAGCALLPKPFGADELVNAVFKCAQSFAEFSA